MIRVASIVCFMLTLLCPAFCLADSGDDCSPIVQSDGDNCEAMTFGAVVEKIDSNPASADDPVPCLDGLFTPESASQSLYSWVRLTAQYRRYSSLPPAANRRRALLQTFLI